MTLRQAAEKLVPLTDNGMDKLSVDEIESKLRELGLTTGEPLTMERARAEKWRDVFCEALKAYLGPETSEGHRGLAALVLAERCVLQEEYAAARAMWKKQFSRLCACVSERDTRIVALESELASTKSDREQLRWMIRKADDRLCDCDNTVPSGNLCSWCSETKDAAWIKEKNATEAELARLKDALPKTADGVTIVLDMPVWDADGRSLRVHSVDCNIGLLLVTVVAEGDEDEDDFRELTNRLYSTEAAALAAKESK